MSDHNILFVLGDARSGTTYVNGLMDRWFDFGMGPEGAFVAEFYARRDSYGDLSDTANFDRLTDDLSRCRMLDIMRNKWEESLRVDVTPELIRKHASEQTFAGAVYGVFAAVGFVQDRPRVGNKWPDYWRHLPMLEALYGEQARYIFVLRDGRDVAMSTMKMDWGMKSAYACANSWVKCTQTVERFAEQTAGERLLVLRYEDLLDDPQTSFERVQAFVGNAPDAERCAEFVAQAEANPMRNNSSKWRAEMDAEDLRVFEAIAGPTLAKHGYDLGCEAPSVSVVERGWYTTSEFLRRVKATLKARLS